MSSQRYISTSFWDDAWIQELDPSEKLLYIYLLTNPLTNIAGIYKITRRRIVFDTGFNSDTVGHILTKFEKAQKVFECGEYIILKNWCKNQNVDSKDNKANNVRKGIDNILMELPEEIILKVVECGYVYKYLDEILKIRNIKPLEAPSRPSNYLNLNSNLNSDSNSDLNSDLNLYTENCNTTDTLSNDIETEELEDNEEPKTKPVKHKYGEYNNVLLSDDEYTKLTTALSKEKADAVIKNFSEIKEMKGYKYKSDYLAIKKWGVRSFDENNKTNKPDKPVISNDWKNRDAYLNCFKQWEG